MKIILLQDEKKLGKKGDIIEASEGYARNYILPKKIGVEASSKNLNDLKLHKANEEKVAQENLDAAKALATELETKQVVVKIKAGEGGPIKEKIITTIITKRLTMATLFLRSLRKPSCQKPTLSRMMTWLCFSSSFAGIKSSGLYFT